MAMGKTIQVLNAMVADRITETYAIAGAVAALNYIEPFLTEDLDVLIAFRSQTPGGLVKLGEIVPYLARLGYGDWRKAGILIEG